jgi:hypothetical protein
MATAGDLTANFQVLAQEPPARRLNIAIRFLGPHSEVESVAVFEAKARWESLLHTDLPDLTVSGPTAPPPECGIALGDQIDDIIVAVQFQDKSEDYLLGFLGEAGVCLLRSESGLPAAGIVTLYRNPIGDGGFELRDIILHEIGHVLGFNSPMNFLGERSRQTYLLAGGKVPSSCRPDPGPRCRGYPPIEEDSYHWSEPCSGGVDDANRTRGVRNPEPGDGRRPGRLGLPR